MKVLGVIPARYGSTRLPGKPLADIQGKTLIRRVYERASLSKALHRLLVATDDARIMEEVKSFGGNCVLTSPDHPNGTCRSAEVAQNEGADIIINIQGDEPLLDPLMIDETTELLRTGDAVSSTLCEPMEDEKSISDPNVVKVVMDQLGYALYFSRSSIPFPRVKGAATVYRHIGIYGYRRDFLFTYAALPATPLSEAESLEQLRILEHGYKMKVGVTKGRCGPSVDTPEDLKKVRELIVAEKGEKMP
ncbi:MAG: 3-deoxy-manno-octulosonate cytidylyltransferase [Aminivibrio sp.]|jgi:3-deoxy-manno-octulosonate cytidylyltransferase (CMP-KDO synthetase)